MASLDQDDTDQMDYNTATSSDQDAASDITHYENTTESESCTDQDVDNEVLSQASDMNEENTEDDKRVF